MLGAAYLQPLSSKFSINHRYWSEFRFIEKTEKGHQFNNIRFRYQFQINYVISSKPLAMIRVLTNQVDFQKLDYIYAKPSAQPLKFIDASFEKNI